MLRLIYIILLGMLLDVISAQEISFNNISTKDGLSSNLVYNVSLDNDSLLWIVSNEGLSSYNGSQVTNYTNEDISGIKNYDFREIVIDTLNTIWLKDDDGYIHYLDKGRNLHSIKSDSSYIKFLNLLHTNEGMVELLSSNGHYKLNKVTNNLDTLHLFSEIMSVSTARQVSTEKDGYFLLTFPGIIKLYNSNTGEVDYAFKLRSVAGAVMLNNNQILASSFSFNKLYVINIETNEIVKNLADDIKRDFPNTNTYFRYMAHIDKDHVGISSGYQGLFILNKNDFSVRNFVHEISNTNSISSDNTFYIYANKNGNVFVTSRTTGFNFFDLNRIDAEYIASFVDPKKDIIFDGHIGLICTDLDDNIWMATSKGLLKYNVTSKRSQFITLSKEQVGYLGINALYCDEKNRIWVAVQSKGLVVLDSKGKEIKRFSIDSKNKIKSNNIRSIIRGEADKIWLTTSRGLNSINVKTLEVGDTLSLLKSQIPKTTIIRSWKVGNDIFFSSSKNEYFLIKDNMIIKLSLGDFSKTKTVFNFAFDNEGLLYQGTSTGVVISRLDSSMSIYNPIDKILDKRTLSLEKDQNGNIWIANENTLYQYNPSKKSLVPYNEENGFGGGGFRMHGSYQDDEGIIYYGMNAGLTRFNPMTINHPSITLNPRLVRINDGENYKFVSSLDSVFIPYSRNNVYISYQNNDIWNSPEIKYQYSSDEGKSWTPALTNPILIQNITPGRLELRLRASIDNDTWTNAPINAIVIVKTPWWRTKWFYTFITFLILGIGYYINKIYSHLKNQKREEKLYDESLKLFSFSLHQYSNIQDVYNTVIEICTEQLKIDMCSVLILDEITQRFQVKAFQVNNGIGTDDLEIENAINSNISFLKELMQTKKPIQLKSVSTEGKGTYNSNQSKITIPILSQSKIIGVIDCQHHSKDYFNERHVSFISAIATIVSTKLEAVYSEEERKNTEIALHNNLQKISEIEMKALRAQMNPHFMFNSLNSINNFILKNDQENASDYLTNFAQLMRIILENSRHDWVSLESELKALRLYINMEKLRFENAFVFIEEIDKNINQMSTMIPPMLIQPYIENAIWHGLLPKKDGVSNLKLKIYRQSNQINIVVEDNGIGRSQSIKNKSKFNITKKSFGMKIISERIKMINNIYKLNASVKIEDLSEINNNEKGTRVILSMKFKNNEL